MENLNLNAVKNKWGGENNHYEKGETGKQEREKEGIRRHAVRNGGFMENNEAAAEKIQIRLALQRDGEKERIKNESLPA